MKIQENVLLAPLTTFKIGGPARFFTEAKSEEDVRAAVRFAHKNSLPLFVLGGGSNLVISDAGWPGMVLKVGITGIAQKSENEKEIFQVGAGEDWDSFVAHTVAENCGGIECLSGIPGTVGGTPVQNVGAYGQEVAETITDVQVFDLQQNALRDFGSRDSGFAYRTSIFNTSARGRYIVLRVTYALMPDASPHIRYVDLKKFFAESRDVASYVSTGKAPPTLAETRDAVRQIRASKAMLITAGDPDCRSAGSFFKNPILTPRQYEEVCVRPAALGKNVPKFSAVDGQLKISAAWLVEHAGFHKGLSRGAVGISSKHALALINRGGARAADIVAFKNEIHERVLDSFGIELHPEPVFVGFDEARYTELIS